MNSDSSILTKPLRLWPGVVAAVLLVVVRFGLPLVYPDGAIFGVLGAVVAAALIVVWWLFFSRVPWSERLGAVGVMIVAGFAARYIIHESIRGGMMGRMFPIFLAIPFLSLALVVGVVIGARLAPRARRAAFVASILLACAAFALLRTDGVTGDAATQIRWRWTPTAEERLLAQESTIAATAGPVEGPAPAAPPKEAAAPDRPLDVAPDRPDAAVASPSETTTAKSSAPTFRRAEWPGFRGPNRDAVVPGVRIETDWTRTPPVELWRRPIGPGWSSFAVQGDLVYTQEQRGDHEVVSCYRLRTGEPVWRHTDAVRFYESNGGPGPRSTPTVHNGRVYTLGATGLLNALDAVNGRVVWSRNAQTDTGAPLPGWGFAGSPVVIDDLVVVATSGRLAGYDAATGKPRWTHTTGGGGYSSPHVMTIDGVSQILLLSGGGATSVSPADGKRLWHSPGPAGVGIVQPASAAAGDVLVAGGDMMGGTGLRRLAVSKGSSGWTVEERWASRGLKPYFNDYVVHKGHVFGFDGTILSCVNLETGERTWKGGRYGAGQMVLLPDQDVLLVLSEEGELALVSAMPDKHTELARFKAIEGKTWNHPVLVGDVLLVRNGEEMAAFRLPRAGS